MQSIPSPAGRAVHAAVFSHLPDAELAHHVAPTYVTDQAARRAWFCAPSTTPARPQSR